MSSNAARSIRSRVVAQQPMGDAGAAVVAGDAEPLEAERRHRLDLVQRHRAFRIGGVIGPAGGFELSP